MKVPKLAAVICGWSFSAVSSAQSVLSKDPCPSAFEEMMEKSKVEAWTAVENFYKKHSKCDDGAYAAGVSGLVADLLDTRWNELSSLKTKFSHDVGFKKFVLNHIDAEVSASEKELTSVKQKLTKSCPAGEEVLCKEIGVAVDRAFKEAGEGNSGK